MANAKENKVTIDGVEYKVSDLSDNAKKLIVKLRITEQEIASLNQKLAIAQTARSAYANALASEISQLQKAKTDSAQQ